MKACGAFTAQVIRGVTIRPSEGIIADYFQQLGQKQISNAVDITNYVLLAMGQPTHAFDLDKITGAVTVRFAHPGESLKLLDGTTRTLTAAGPRHRRRRQSSLARRRHGRIRHHDHR